MKPSRIVLEMILFFFAFFLPGYLSQAGAAAAGPADTISMLRIIVTGLPQFLLMLYVATMGSDSCGPL